MERKESSSSVDNTDRDDKEDNIDIVTTLNTPFQPTAIKLQASTWKKMKEQDEWIKLQQKQIEELTFNLTIKDSHIENLRRDETISRLPSLPTANGFSETPGPHRLQLKPERPEDVAYRAKLEEQESAEKATGQQEKSPDSQEALLSVFQSLTKVLEDNNQHLQSSDVTEPTKSNGLDTQWDDFYLQLRTYLEVKG
jgi:hypothetical protein